MTNNLFHKDCPIPRKRKLEMVLHHQICDQMEPNDKSRMQTNWKKMNKNWDFLNPNSSMYNFPELCENCSKNVIWGYSGYVKSGYSGFGQSGNGIQITNKPRFFQKIWNIIKYIWNL